MVTTHIETNIEDISSTVIMPGDPLRAKFIAEKFLTDIKLVNSVRNMTAYTGYYKGKKVTVFPSGVGIPSMGIYAYELYEYYNVDTIIRVGSCGTCKEDINLFDIILVDNSYSESNFTKSYLGIDSNVSSGNSYLNNKIIDTAKKLGQNIILGNVFCREVFYSIVTEPSPLVKQHDCLAFEMESYALFHVARSLNKKASTVLTVSDSVITNEAASPKEREQGFSDMILLVLESIV